MNRLLKRHILVCAIATMGAFGWPKLASAVGYFNTPGDFCQWAGHGFGGGYHAPFVLGPVHADRAVLPNVRRYSRAPNPYACGPHCGSLAGSYGEDIAAPTVLPMTSAAEPAR